MTNANETYNAALSAFGVASRSFDLVTKQYRLRDIGDAEFLAARAKFAKAQQELDAAEVAFMQATGADLRVLP